MARAIIRVILEGVDDVKVLEIKKQVEEIVKDIEKAEVEVTMLGR
jgi:hypothetical protein